MSYIRVIPRDLFNEANLLKCMGQVALIIDNFNNFFPDVKLLPETVDHFHIVQDASDGSIAVDNVQLHVRGKPYRLWRPLNSRRPWPLYLRDGDMEIDVFQEDGTLTPEMSRFLRGPDDRQHP